MKKNFLGISLTLMLLLGAAAGAVFAAEDDKLLTTQAARMDRYATAKGQTLVSGKTAAEFSSFYGQTNSQALADGLRSGSEITLTTQAPDGAVSTATFTPPTGRMGNGNVYISMALAQEQLTAAGITAPTAQQIEAAMVGGTLVPGGETMNGVLQMRASGMGWGQIAQSLGTKLGHVISGMKSANAALSRTTVQTGTSTSTAAGKAATAKPKTATGTGKSGVVSAGGSGGANVVDSKASGEKSGIVTGAGTAGGASSPAGGAKSQGQGAGIVTGGGTGGSGGQGKAYGKGGK